jgi:hypothetical protein
LETDEKMADVERYAVHVYGSKMCMDQASTSRTRHGKIDAQNAMESEDHCPKTCIN